MALKHFTKQIKSFVREVRTQWGSTWYNVGLAWLILNTAEPPPEAVVTAALLVSAVVTAALLWPAVLAPPYERRSPRRRRRLRAS